MSRQPTTGERLAYLEACGDQFPDAPTETLTLPTYSYTGKDGLKRSPRIALESARQIGLPYTHNSDLRQILGSAGLNAHSFYGIRMLLQEVLAPYPRPLLGLHAADILLKKLAAPFSPRLVIGFSGYDLPGHSYRAESIGIQTVLATLKRHRKPRLVLDRGTRYGVTGLSGLLAERMNIDTLGYIPLQELESIAPRRHTIMYGRQLEDTADLFMPDLLCVLGGDSQTREEYRTTLRMGGKVLLLALRDYPTSALVHAYHELPETESALAAGHLAVCQTAEHIGAMLETLLQDRSKIYASRPARLSSLLNRFQSANWL